MRPALGKRAFVPNSFLDPKTVGEAKRALRFSEVSADRVSHIMNAYEPEDTEDEYDYSDFKYTVVGEEVTVNEYRECRGGVSLPRAWAMKRWPNMPWVDRTVFPTHDIPFTGTVEPRDAKQEKFFNDLLQAAEQPGPQNLLANATTGSGKTVASIYLGWQLSTPTLIVVDSNKIARGWLKNFRQFFGQGWTDRNVGRIQQKECDYKNKAFVIAMAQSLARRQYPKEMYSHFGMYVIDEIQVFGGPHFSPILYMFPARIHVGVTAENRSGAFGRLIKTHLGDTRVVSKQEVMKPNAWVFKNKLERPFYCYSDGAILSNLSVIPERNAKIANLIKTRGYDRQRNVLVLSNRTQQLLTLKKRCVDLGVPADAMGIHAGTYQTDRFVVYYLLEGSKKRNRLALVDTYSKGRTLLSRLQREDYAGITMPEALYNRLQRGEKITFEQAREQYSPTQHELDNITHSCQIIFATYEIFSKGVDVPRLDMGVEALPSGNVKQPAGRILRISDGKETPEWYAIHDTISATKNENGFVRDSDKVTILTKYFDGKTKARIGALRKHGAKVKIQ